MLARCVHSGADTAFLSLTRIVYLVK